MQGIRSCQAWLAASATRGEEAEQWRIAAKWLEELEADARRAYELLQLAEQAERAGRPHDVASLRDAAASVEASIEQRYIEQRYLDQRYCEPSGCVHRIFNTDDPAGC